MDFTFTPDQAAFKDAVRGFAQRHLAEGALQRAHEPGFPFKIAALMAEQGLLGITIPEEDGGQGGSLMDAVIAIEEIAAVCPRSADVVQFGNFGALRTFAEYANQEQKARYLPDLLSGKKAMSLAMSEPEAGSAATELRTMAVPDGDGFRISGSKVFSTHSSDASLFLVYVRFGPGLDGIGSVLIERDTAGFTLGQESAFMSGENWRHLYFEDCYIGPEQVLLPAGGFKRQIAGFNAERIGNSARSVAVGRYALNLAREHTLTRKQFGRPLCEFQGIQWKMAERAIHLDAAQLLLYRAAMNAQNGFPSAYETAAAKVMCNQAGFDAANEAMQLLGGLGFCEESLVEYCVRRTRGWMIAGGSLEMMKNRIAEEIYGRRFSQRPGS